MEICTPGYAIEWNDFSKKKKTTHISNDIILHCKIQFGLNFFLLNDSNREENIVID